MYVYTVIWSNIFTAIYKKFVVLSEMHELHLINKLFKVLYTDTVSCVHVARQSWLRLVRCFCMLVPDLCLNPIDWTGFLNAQFTEAWLACPQAYRVVCQSPLWWHGPLGWDVIRLSLRFRDYGWRITTPQRLPSTGQRLRSHQCSNLLIQTLKSWSKGLSNPYLGSLVHYLGDSAPDMPSLHMHACCVLNATSGGVESPLTLHYISTARAYCQHFYTVHRLRHRL